MVQKHVTYDVGGVKGVSARCILRLSVTDHDRELIFRELLKGSLEMSIGGQRFVYIDMGMNVVLGSSYGPVWLSETDTPSYIPAFVDIIEKRGSGWIGAIREMGWAFSTAPSPSPSLASASVSSKASKASKWPAPIRWDGEYIEIPLVYDYFFGDYINCERLRYHNVKFTFICPSSLNAVQMEIIPESSYNLELHVHNDAFFEHAIKKINGTCCPNLIGDEWVHRICVRRVRYLMIMIYTESDTAQLPEITSIRWTPELDANADPYNIDPNYYKPVDCHYNGGQYRLYIININPKPDLLDADADTDANSNKDYYYGDIYYRLSDFDPLINRMTVSDVSLEYARFCGGMIGTAFS